MDIFSDLKEYINQYTVNPSLLNGAIKDGCMKLEFRYPQSFEPIWDEKHLTDTARLVDGLVNHPYANRNIEDIKGFYFDSSSGSQQLLVDFSDMDNKENIIRDLSTRIIGCYLIASSENELFVYRDGRNSIKDNDVLIEYYVSKNDSENYSLDMVLLDNDRTSDYYKDIVNLPRDESPKIFISDIVHMPDLNREQLHNLGVSNNEIDSLDDVEMDEVGEVDR